MRNYTLLIIALLTVLLIAVPASASSGTVGTPGSLVEFNWSPVAWGGGTQEPIDTIIMYTIQNFTDLRYLAGWVSALNASGGGYPSSGSVSTQLVCGGRLVSTGTFSWAFSTYGDALTYIRYDANTWNLNGTTGSETCVIDSAPLTSGSAANAGDGNNIFFYYLHTPTKAVHAYTYDNSSCLAPSAKGYEIGYYSDWYNIWYNTSITSTNETVTVERNLTVSGQPKTFPSRVIVMNATHTFVDENKASGNTTVTGVGPRPYSINITDPYGNWYNLSSTEDFGTIPVADFTSDVTMGEAPLAVAFTDLSAGTPTSWSWDFGGDGVAYTQNPSHTFTLPGTYYVNLSVSNSWGSDYEYKAGYITISGGSYGPGAVNVTGHALDGYTGGTIATALINATQPTLWVNTTSNATGGYYLQGFETNKTIYVYAAKAGYGFTPVSFTPPANGTYQLDLVMFQDYIPNSTAIYGIVYTSWDGTPLSGATVTISNGTWSDTNTSTSTGFFMFDSLAGGTSYSISATASGHSASSSYSVTATNGAATQQNIPMDSAYTLTVYARDGTTSNLLAGVPVYIQLSDTQVANTTTGIAIFTVNGGYFTITGTATGYSTGQTSASVTGNSVATLLMYNQTQTNPGTVYYTPHQVRFAVKDQWGAPLPLIAVSAQGYETTAGSWDWLTTLFGINIEKAPIQNATMQGTTDSTGSIVFTMIESVKYEMLLTNTTLGVNDTYSVYPKDDYYEIWVTTGTGGSAYYTGGGNILELINITVSTEQINTSYGKILIAYNDTSLGTTGGTIYINQTNKTAVDLPDITVDSQAIPSSWFNTTFTVPGDDESYFVVFGIDSSVFGHITRTFSVIFPKSQVGIGLPSSWLVYIAVFFILFTGMFFGAVTSPTIGAVITCFVGWIMWSIGWLADMGMAAPTALVFATFLSILSVIMVRSRKERWI